MLNDFELTQKHSSKYANAKEIAETEYKIYYTKIKETLTLACLLSLATGV